MVPMLLPLRTDTTRPQRLVVRAAVAVAATAWS